MARGDGSRGAVRLVPRPGVVALAAAVLAAAHLVAPAGAGAVEGPEAQQLADRHVPVVAVRAQPRPCGPGEPYRPTAVESVLGKPDVVLRGPRGEVIAAPTAADLHGRGADWHLDLPGNALEPGCGYERWSRANGADDDPVVYARVARDPGEPGWLVLQYWLFWVFNDWNDRHEADWEMVQLHFEASTVAEALAGEPTRAVYAQHEGAEQADWASTEVAKRGAHPVVHSSMGSHASYFSAHRWLGKGASTGFGCDDSRPPLTLLEPRAVLLPDEVRGPQDPFAWLAYSGRWGERHAGFNNGPTGPNEKDQWSAPVAWADEHGRDGSVALPELGTSVTDFFCAATGWGSRLLVGLLDDPLVVGAGLVALAVAVAVVVRRTRWRPGLREPIAARRRAGQIVNASTRLVAAHTPLLGGLGLVLLAAGALATVMQVVVLELTPAENLADVVDRESALGVPLAHAAGVAVTLPATCLVAAAVMAAVRDLEAGGAPTVAGVLGAALRPASAALAALVLLVLLAASTSALVLVPVGLWLLARWAIAAPACVVEGLGVRAGLARSAELTRGRRWRVLAVGLFCVVAATILGPVAGTIVLLVSEASILVVNVVSALVGVVTVPLAAVALSLLYYDRRVAEGAPERALSPPPTPPPAARSARGGPRAGARRRRSRPG